MYPSGCILETESSLCVSTLVIYGPVDKRDQGLTPSTLCHRSGTSTRNIMSLYMSNLYDIPTCLTVHPANEVARVSPAENGALLCFSW